MNTHHFKYSSNASIDEVNLRLCMIWTISGRNSFEILLDLMLQRSRLYFLTGVILPKVRQQDADLFDAAIKVPRKERRACCKE